MRKSFIFGLLFLLCINCFCETPKLKVNSNEEGILYAKRFHTKDGTILFSDVKKYEKTESTTSKIVSFYIERQGAYIYVDSMYTIEIPEGAVGDGFMDMDVDERGFYIHQVFADGSYFVVSYLYFSYENQKLKLIGYVEDVLDRHEPEKDFVRTEFEIPSNVYMKDVDSDFVYRLHSSGKKKK